MKPHLKRKSIWIGSTGMWVETIKKTDSNDKSYFSIEGVAAPHDHYTSTKICYPIGAAFSMAPPHFTV